MLAVRYSRHVIWHNAANPEGQLTAKNFMEVGMRNLLYYRLPIIVLLIALATTSTLSRTQEIPKLKPGADEMKTPDFKPFTVEWEWGTMRLKKTNLFGKPIYSIVNELSTPQGILLDHIGIDAKTLAMVYKHSPYLALGPDYLVAHLNGNKLIGSLTSMQTGQPTALEAELESPVFEETIWGLTLNALPLKEGFQARLPRFAILRSRSFTASWVTVKVTGHEQIKGGDGKKYDCWVVNLDYEGSPLKETHWISNQVPYEIKQVKERNGAKRTFEFKRFTLD